MVKTTNQWIFQQAVSEHQQVIENLILFDLGKMF
jgi:hypothetical protein